MTCGGPHAAHQQQRQQQPRKLVSKTCVQTDREHQWDESPRSLRKWRARTHKCRRIAGGTMRGGDERRRSRKRKWQREEEEARERKWRNEWRPTTGRATSGCSANSSSKHPPGKRHQHRRGGGIDGRGQCAGEGREAENKGRKRRSGSEASAGGRDGVGHGQTGNTARACRHTGAGPRRRFEEAVEVGVECRDGGDGNDGDGRTGDACGRRTTPNSGTGTSGTATRRGGGRRIVGDDTRTRRAGTGNGSGRRGSRRRRRGGTNGGRRCEERPAAAPSPAAANIRRADDVSTGEAETTRIESKSEAEVETAVVMTFTRQSRLRSPIPRFAEPGIA